MNAILQCLLNIDIFSKDLMIKYILLKKILSSNMTKNINQESFNYLKDIDISFKQSLYR
jgi:hypothetical protein